MRRKLIIIEIEKTLNLTVILHMMMIVKEI